MTYLETLDFLYTKLPLFSRIGAAAYKEDLGNTLKLCSFLGNPQTGFRSVHIAGTNGKGSVSHMLASIFQAAGYKTGLYTSPHLKDFRERIRINGEMISESFVVDFTSKMTPLINSIEPSFFELTVAMAFDYFKQSNVDIAIIETGLGGRLDSTNVITPDLSIITNIGMDHMNLLGNTLGSIASEKAGIIKPHVPVVIGEVIPETLPVFEQRAADMQSPLSIASRKRQAVDWKWEKHELVVEIADPLKTDHEVYHLDLPGLYQRKNLLTALEASHILKELGWNIDETNVRDGLRKVKKATGLHGRWDIVHVLPTVVLDVAHNPDGIKQLLEQVELTDPHHLHLVIGFVKDKDIHAVLSLLPPSATYYFTQANIPRALDKETLQMAAAQYGLKGKAFPNVNDALTAAKQVAFKNDLIVVCGSVFLVGEVA